LPGRLPDDRARGGPAGRRVKTPLAPARPDNHANRRCRRAQPLLAHDDDPRLAWSNDTDNGALRLRAVALGRFPGETSCLTLVWAVLNLYITHATNGIRFTQLDRQRLNRIKYAEPEQTIPEEVSAA
jgi:hypothetical protein